MAEYPNDQREELFADSTTPQKRENPYKKKKKTPPPKPTEIEVEDVGEEDAPTPQTSPRKSLKDRWDDFIFAHVKLIVFIVGVTVVVMLLGPFSVFRIAEWVQDAKEQAEMAEKDALTVQYVRGLCDKAEPITWRDFEPFYYEDRSSSKYCTWIIPVEGQYEVWIGGADTNKMPDYVTMYSSTTGEKVELTEGLFTLDEFLADNQ